MKLIDQLNMYLKANPEKNLLEMAKEMGITPSVLYEFKRGNRNIRLDIAEKIKEYIEK